VAFDWKLIEQTCPGVTRVVPTGMALAVVYIDFSQVMATVKEAEVPEALEGILSPEHRAFSGAVDCVKGHGLDVVGVVEAPIGVLALRVRRKLLAELWQRLRLYRQQQ
jgi:hypothetical protein